MSCLAVGALRQPVRVAKHQDICWPDIAATRLQTLQVMNGAEAFVNAVRLESGLLELPSTLLVNTEYRRWQSASSCLNSALLQFRTDLLDFSKISPLRVPDRLSEFASRMTNGVIATTRRAKCNPV
jgi:hypothetical protein